MSFLEKEPNIEIFVNSLEREKLASLSEEVKIYPRGRYNWLPRVTLLLFF